ncbi:hypothetical protein POM88_018667 [Heracleum sosnowskyi]|uniref:Uncharacterized protein n=1 Tax=Heracleum sosnowskyi TaxID=360622 RepID=A0AAD8IQY7_9APIA|nr:hypothetical protein POM88_018667 [Heracleum sosnowskyi]
MFLPLSVLYLAKDQSLKGHDAVQSIHKGSIVEKRDVSSLLPALMKDLNVDSLSCPMIFIGGRYIGGLPEFTKLKESGRLWFLLSGSAKVQDDICRLSIRRSKFYICLEAVDSRRRHMYIIYSIHETLLCTKQTYPPTMKQEAVIFGYPSMGCGTCDSKIIFAGGQRPLDRDRHNNCIAFDMTDNSVNNEPFIPMDKGKFKPLVFQLNKRLYVCGSEYSFKSRNDADFLSIEFYSPAMRTRWRTVSNIFKWPRGSNDFLANYACLVFGNSCLMSVPYEDATYITHCNFLESVWVKHSDASLPFTGLAASYSQTGYTDFVMIYFKEGVVRVCKFDFSCIGDSKDLFTLKSNGENMRGYFADCGKGRFCLTAFDKSHVYVCTFVVTRVGIPSDPLHMTHRILSSYNFHFDQFSIEGRKITSVVGCSVPTPNEEAKLFAEKLAAAHYKNYMKVNDDYDPWDTDNIKSLILQD